MKSNGAREILMYSVHPPSFFYFPFAPPKMMRTRLLWFAVGFSAAGAAIARFVWRDLMADRASKSSQMKHHFEALEVRISELESIASRNSEEVAQDEG